MDPSETLSGYLREHLKDFDKDFVEDTVPPEEREEHKQTVQLLHELIHEILGSVETIRSKCIYGFLLDNPFWREFFELEIDDKYTRDMLDRVPKMVHRTLQLSRMLTDADIRSTILKGNQHISKRSY
jgi:hypothetical protein